MGSILVLYYYVPIIVLTLLLYTLRRGLWVVCALGEVPRTPISTTTGVRSKKPPFQFVVGSVG